MATAVQPDVELAVVNFARAYPSLTNATNGSPAGLGATVGTELPASPTWPFVVVQLADSAMTWPGWVARVRLQVDVYADTKKKARDAAFTFIAAFFDLTGVHNGAVLSGPDLLSGPRYIPDPVTTPARPHYIVDLTITAHPAR